MKLEYLSAEMEIVLFDDEDVITTSGDSGGLTNGGIDDGKSDSGSFDELFPNLK